jgi:hypothetical protein
MRHPSIQSLDWWKKQRTNFVYVAMAAGILCFLAFAAIWETFYVVHDQNDSPAQVLGNILLKMLMHSVVWVPFLFMEIWAYRFLPRLDLLWNAAGLPERRILLLISACVIACFLPLSLPAVLVWVHG